MRQAEWIVVWKALPETNDTINLCEKYKGTFFFSVGNW